MSADDLRITHGGAADVDRLRDLWLELHHHHQLVAPQTGDFTDDDTSWAFRSASYREWLEDERSFLLLAERGDQLAGYALVRVMSADNDLRDSWTVPDTVAELETIVVTESARGGTGTKLLDAADAELDRLGITYVMVGLMPGNEGAQRLYESRGFVPKWTQMVRRRSTTD